MNLLKAAFLLVSTVVAMATPGVLRAQGVHQQMLLHPPADSWPGYHGDYSGRRHSALNQITPQNVKNLTLAWAFQTQQAMQIKSSPLLVDGILYFTNGGPIFGKNAGVPLRAIEAGDINVARVPENSWKRRGLRPCRDAE